MMTAQEIKEMTAIVHHLEGPHDYNLHTDPEAGSYTLVQWREFHSHSHEAGTDPHPGTMGLG